MNIKALKTTTVIAATLVTGMTTVSAAEDTVEALKSQVQRLERQLALAQSKLTEAKENETKAIEELAVAEETISNAADLGPKKINIGDFAIGGAIKTTYTYGDYPSGDGPTKGSNGGNFALDSFNVDVGYSNGNLTGKLNYRFYDGLNLLHTGYLGYAIDDDSSVKVGVTRVPFGPGAFGVSNSWFFDQHYYVGLADDMDLGVNYSSKSGAWAWDVGYFIEDEGSWNGASVDSARYSYDSVVWEQDFNGDGNLQRSGYKERNQVNLRGIYSFVSDSVSTDLGFSLQYGQLAGVNAKDGDAYAGSVHMKNSYGNYTLTTQLTHYKYDIDNSNLWGNGDLIPMGAFDYAYPVASEATIPAIALSRSIKTEEIDWLDSVTLYTEYSSILKNGKTVDGEDFNDSSLFLIGAAWARGGWYIYTDLGFSDGNYFVGGDAFTNFGENADATWQSRLLVNLAYYF